MKVVVVPCLKDNFAYLVIDEATRRAAIVDPGEAPPIVAAVAREGVELVAIWATHHHADHVGGVKDLLAAQPGLEVVAGDVDAPKIAGVTRALPDGGELTLGNLRGHVIHNPGHTLGAITFVIEERGDRGRVEVGEGEGAAEIARATRKIGAASAFTGDTLFAAGCGRLFEGDAKMMQASLAKLAALPPDTKVYFGHEYTAANLRFAVAVEPENSDVAQRAADLQLPSTPSTIAVELRTNPFLRWSEPAVILAAKARGAESDPASVFGAIRAWKDGFK